MRNPLDPFSEVLNEKRRWDPEWYSWLQELATSTTRLETAVPPTIDLSGMEAQIATLQAQVATLQATSPPGAVFILRQAVTTPVTAIDFTGLTNTYEAYLFEGTNLSCDQDGAAIFLRASLNNGASFDSSAVYYYDLIYHYNTSGSPYALAATGNASVYHQVTHGQGGVSSIAFPFDFNLTVYGAGTGARYASYISHAFNYHSTANGLMAINSSGIFAAGGGLNAVRFLNHTGGNIVSGSITMYGMRRT